MIDNEVLKHKNRARRERIMARQLDEAGHHAAANRHLGYAADADAKADAAEAKP